MISRHLVLLLLLTVNVCSVTLMTFDEFIVKFNKNYTQGSEEYNQKKKIFDFNVEQLKAKNCEACGVTKFFDVASEEFKKKYLNLEQAEVKTSSALPLSDTPFQKLSAPKSIDWRQRGVITSVKDQGDCGCCWAFASCALAESALIMKGLASQSIDLSEQYMLKCTPDGDCDGGYLENGLKQISTFGAPLESKYPYRPYSSSAGICFGLSNTRVTNKAPLSYYRVSDDNIKNLLTTGPLAIAIDSTDWQSYVRGIWKCSPTGSVNHAVLLVGYTEDGLSWIIKNQWGADWGQDGYMYVSTDPRYNCKIGTAVHKLYENTVQVVLVVLAVVIMGFFI